MKNPDQPITEKPKLKVDPYKLKLNHDGYVWRDVFVRLPKEAIADDLKEPGLWREVQKGPNALRKFDRLIIVAYDESWFAECVVSYADNTQAMLAKPRITTIGARADQLFSDDTYRVEWNGAGFIVRRLADGAQVDAQTYSNAALAERALGRLYPQRA